MNARASFTFSRTSTAIVIVDLCAPGLPTVTNDPEAVVEEVLRDVGLSEMLRLPVVYRDSMGYWNQLRLWTDGRFKEFRLLNRARTIQEAMDFLSEEGLGLPEAEEA